MPLIIQKKLLMPEQSGEWNNEENKACSKKAPSMFSNNLKYKKLPINMMYAKFMVSYTRLSFLRVEYTQNIQERKNKHFDSQFMKMKKYNYEHWRVKAFSGFFGSICEWWGKSKGISGAERPPWIKTWTTSLCTTALPSDVRCNPSL